MTGAYRPIADYAMIGDARSAALISRDGSIDWLCWPRFDSRSVFAKILDAARGGCFSIAPSIEFSSKRRYLEETNVLETIFETDRGNVRLLDLMPALTEEQKRRRMLPVRQLLRRVEGISGEVPMLATYEPRPDYARVTPTLDFRRADTVWCARGPEVWHLRSNVQFDIEGPTACARFNVGRDERRHFALSYERHAPAVFGNIDQAADEEIDSTIAWWKSWASKLTYDGPHREHVLRSALVLKLLAYAPSGGIVAAPTTSLPERIGGIRNWDYRYCWLRDAAFTVSALYECGFEVEGAAFVDWLLYATRLTQPRLQIVYDVFGESRLPETTLDHLEGYLGSRPVHIGNAAHDQFQLDIYGEVLGAVEEFTNRGEALFGDARRLITRLANRVAKRWREPDSGIWEKRSERQQHVHSKVMAWAALDCASRLAEKGLVKDNADAWHRTKDEIKNDVIEHGFNRDLNSFVSIYDSDELDASLLYISRVGFLDADDPRILGTIDAIRHRLGRDDLLYRYEWRTEDGLPPGEGAFLPCSFLLVEALAIAKRFDEAEDVFEKLCKRGNDLGLFSEEIDVDSGALIGNFPQALTHIGLMNAALRLRGERPSRPQ
ncbi:MAG TPA: glycoside hydrolase family 15 protein [Thermoanaerobaculia bacterium]|jgi:GH15 family glucan-1,4-alpha-glucosidase|nr:glycoside hydrolase family 15 protein [Thermoanaerobaculia bacterium]